MKNAIFAFSIKWTLLGVGYFNMAWPELGYFIVRMTHDLQKNFLTTLQNRNP